MRRNKRTFKQILTHLARPNRNSLMRKAHIANRVAKKAHGLSKQRTYDIKIKALKALATKFDREVLMQQDARTPDMIVVAVLNTRFGLHAPKECFS
jgi:hypothetical protein